MISVVSWKWKAPPGYRSTFEARHVNVLRNMVERNLDLPHEFVCVTDDPAGIDPGIRIVPLWTEWSELQAFVGNARPACYRRLRAFSADAAGLGERILSIDLDCVITGNITPLVERSEDFVIWGDTAKGTLYNGGLWLLRAGTRRQVFDRFDPKESPMVTHRAGIIGSDQAWISYVLGRGEAMWTKADGVYSFRNHIQPYGAGARLPDNARIVMFHGKFDPWDGRVQFEHPWITKHYQ